MFEKGGNLNYVSKDGATALSLSSKTEFLYENVPNYDMQGFYKKDDHLLAIFEEDDHEELQLFENGK